MEKSIGADPATREANLAAARKLKDSVPSGPVGLEELRALRRRAAQLPSAVPRPDFDALEAELRRCEAD